ncbi:MULTISPECIES: ATP-binding cassette domain-containing protein [Cytobacillus]|uniref:ABC transporter ATP-binding protein n=1 Tax=Cytobacillus stercorigallinarum TaxID=2762240 RepID=A0ABR8QSV1_9BACI|nr:ATP-binding cassette domain-containing protein [Cytobacillus stercorigallinarum]MBD7938347.1 ABC transporter ATP-binding protein [Cytobacillus stercorigallinarum]
MQNESLLDVQGLTKVYGNKGSLFVPRKEMLAVNNVSFSIKKGETFGLIGESGSGKTTIGRMVLRLIEATAGDIQYEGKSILSMKKGEMDKLRSEMQIIFQDSGSAFNPRKTIGEQILHPLNKFHSNSDAGYQYNKVIEMLDVVGLRADFYHRYPHELSGGQRQRAGIARALIVKPKFLVLDEPVSALDVSVKAQIINLLIDLQKEFQLTYLFIAHNLDLVAYFCDKVAVLSKGELIETAPTIELFRKPKHEVTQKLLSSILTLDGDLGEYYRKQSAI